MTQVDEGPASIFSTPDSPGTRWGLPANGAVPPPSWPSRPEPQQETSPSAWTAQVWSEPAASATAS